MALVALGRVQQQRVRDLAQTHSRKLQTMLGVPEDWSEAMLNEQKLLTSQSKACSEKALQTVNALGGACILGVFSVHLHIQGCPLNSLSHLREARWGAGFKGCIASWYLHAYVH